MGRRAIFLLRAGLAVVGVGRHPRPAPSPGDRKSTRLNSSHGSISYAVFCLKKKNMSALKKQLLKYMKLKTVIVYNNNYIKLFVFLGIRLLKFVSARV